MKGAWRYDGMRTLRQGVFGAFFIGPVMHRWFALLEKVVPAGRAGPLVKVGLDQAIIGPLVCFSFFSLMGLMVRATAHACVRVHAFARDLTSSPPPNVPSPRRARVQEGQSTEQIERKLRNDFWPTLVMNWKYISTTHPPRMDVFAVDTQDRSMLMCACVARIGFGGGG